MKFVYYLSDKPVNYYGPSIVFSTHIMHSMTHTMQSSELVNIKWFVNCIMQFVSHKWAKQEMFDVLCAYTLIENVCFVRYLYRLFKHHFNPKCKHTAFIIILVCLWCTNRNENKIIRCWMEMERIVCIIFASIISCSILRRRKRIDDNIRASENAEGETVSHPVWMLSVLSPFACPHQLHIE